LSAAVSADSSRMPLAAASRFAFMAPGFRLRAPPRLPSVFIGLVAAPAGGSGGSGGSGGCVPARARASNGATAATATASCAAYTRSDRAGRQEH
jgi:hypothetical protein